MMGRTTRKNPEVRRRPTESDPNVNLPDENGWTPLMKACNRESLDKVNRLIAAGADVRKADAERFGPMMCACVEGRTDVVLFLISHSAKVDGTATSGRTPLSWT